MDDRTRQKLEHDRALGEMHQRAYDNSVKPFIEAKQLELYAAFVDSPTSDTEGLMAIKMQTNALSSLKDEFESFITTGNLASQQLKENNDER